MLVTLSTDKTVSETASALQAAVQANHFGVMLIGWPLNLWMVRLVVVIAPGYLDRSHDTAERNK